MPFSRTERFTLKSRIVDEINDDDTGWDFGRRNLLLSEFGFETIESGWNGPGFEDLIANISDSDLVEMYSVVTGIKQDEVLEAVELLNPATGNPVTSGCFFRTRPGKRSL